MANEILGRRSGTCACSVTPPARKYQYYRDIIPRPRWPDQKFLGPDFLERPQTILKENIPFIDIPDSNIQDVYYYRWSSLQRHLRYTVAGTGYILTEFVQPVGYAQALNTIDAAAGHQIDEARWLRSSFYNDDYIQVYTRGPGNTTQYTHWIIDSLYRRSQVDGNADFVTEQLEDLVRMWGEWDYTFDSEVGLYYFTPNFDAQEYSLPGYVVASSGNPTLQLDGPDTYRPSHNAYMFANAKAISNIASIAGNTLIASQFSNIADNIATAILNHLWDPEQEFFVDVVRTNNPNLTRVTGREEVGFYPFRFNIGLDAIHANTSVQQLFDPEGFQALYGPTTLEIRNQYFDAAKSDSYCCYWNGQSWPFSTAHMLKSLAAIRRSGNSSVTAEQYVQYLSTYASTQQKDGVSYVAESHYPLNTSWSADSANHSEHYDHSTNNDDIDPIIPQNWTYFAIENIAYHGHLVTVLYDLDGSRYSQGPGLNIFVNGHRISSANSTTALVPLPSSSPTPTAEAPINIAANPNGLGSYPLANATSTYYLDDPYKAIDGYLFFDNIPDNRWTNYQSTSPNDTLQITFARPRNISSVTLALYSDVARNGAVDVPSSIEIYGSSGLLITATSNTLLANDRNTLNFDTVETKFVVVNLFNKPNASVGICDLEIWTPPPSGPIYYAVDALLSSAEVTSDPQSNATTTGSVVGMLSSQSTVSFSGIISGDTNELLTLSYSNSATSAVSVSIIVNQVAQQNITLAPTTGKYVTVTADVVLAAGKNFLALVGGDNGIRYETISFPNASEGSNETATSSSAIASSTHKSSAWVTAPSSMAGLIMMGIGILL